MPVRLVFVVDEIVGVHVTQQHDIASPPAVAPVGTAPGFEFLAAKRDAAAATVSGRQFHSTLVNKHGATMQKAADLPTAPCGNLRVTDRASRKRRQTAP